VISFQTNIQVLSFDNFDINKLKIRSSFFYHVGHGMAGNLLSIVCGFNKHPGI